MFRSWKIYVLAAVVIAALAGLSALLLNQVEDVRLRAKTAEDRVEEFAGRLSGFQSVIDEIERRQEETQTMVYARLDEDFSMQQQLSQLRSDLSKVMSDDPESNAWADQPIPAALIDRLWGFPKAGARAGEAANRAGTTAGRADR